jgi:hypothetical protein
LVEAATGDVNTGDLGVGTGSPNSPPDTDTTKPSHGCGFEDGGVVESSIDNGGGSFTPTWATDAAWCTDDYARSHQVIWDGTQIWYLGEEGKPLTAAWRIGHEDWDRTLGPASPTGVPYVFPADTDTQQQSDWMATASNDTLYVIRRDSTSPGYTFALASATDHTFNAGATIDSTDAGVADSGLFLAPSGTGLLLFAFASNSTHSLRYTRWSGSSWSAWQTLVTDTGAADHLAGYVSPVDGRIGLVWESTFPAVQINGLLVPSTLP